MRKLIFVLAGSMGFTAFSQDVIVTKSSEQIRAKIIEVTDDAVSYKKYHDQEGATFVLKKDKIKIISWENGNVDEYEQKPAEEISPVKESNNLPFIKKRGSTFYLDNGEVYSAEQLKDFLTEKNLTHTWLRYEKGSNLLLTGWVLIGTGATMYVVGMMSMFNGNGDSFLPGILLTSVGGALAMYVGMPIAIVGNVKRTRTINEYNSIYGGRPRPQYSQDVTFKAGFTGNGLGFTLNF